MELEELKQNYRKLSLEEIKKEFDNKIIDIENIGDKIKTLSVLTDTPHPFKRLSIEYCALYDIARENGLNKTELTGYAEKYLDTTSKLLNRLE
jgi:hypothetical protein